MVNNNDIPKPCVICYFTLCYFLFKQVDLVGGSRFFDGRFRKVRSSGRDVRRLRALTADNGDWWFGNCWCYFIQGV
jgi:hypothetical protein